MGLKDFFNNLVKRSRKKEVEPDDDGSPKDPLSFLEVSEPAACLAAELLFPLSFSVGEIPVRSRVLRLAAGQDAFDPAPGGPWFVWKAETPMGKLIGYWQLPNPAQGSDPAAESAWLKTAGTLASGAAAKLKATLASRTSSMPASFAAGPSAPPPLAGKPVFRVDFKYAVRGVFREGRAYASLNYPLLIAKSFGCESSAPRADPIGSLLAASQAMLRDTKGAAWVSRTFKFPVAEGLRSYIPIYELFNLLSDSDLRLVIQNNLVTKTRGGNLGAVFLYRQRVQTDKGIKEILVPPQSFDHQRDDSLFPEAVFAEGRLDPKNAAMNADDFIRRNDAVYENLFLAIRTNTLSLSAQGTLLIREIYVAMVFASKRRKLEAMIKTGKPLSELAKLPERIARRAVDSSGGKDLASAVFGSAEALAFVSKWCSKRKNDEVKEELKRIDDSLTDGTANIDSIIAERNLILEKAKTLIETERREQERLRERNAKRK